MKANFVVKHYASDQWPIAKSDVGIELEISGADREQTEDSIKHNYLTPNRKK